jgi:hypothetical protein
MPGMMEIIKTCQLTLANQAQYPLHLFFISVFEISPAAHIEQMAHCVWSFGEMRSKDGSEFSLRFNIGAKGPSAMRELSGAIKFLLIAIAVSVLLVAGAYAWSIIAMTMLMSK